jgi:tetratricopeptide (TPR) repeat protein
MVFGRPGTLASMPKALSPRRGQPRSAKPPTSGLPREVVAELRRVARPGRSDQAIADLERAVTLLDRGDSKGAAAEATKAKRAASRSPAVREVLGLALYGQGRYREALSEMQTYKRMTGRADENHIIADSLRATGRPDRAVALAEEALAAPIPDAAKAEAAVVAGSALADMGRYDQALALLRRVRTRDDVARPEVLRVWYVTADILARSGRRAEAVREFKKILRHDAGAFDVAERLDQLA